MIKCGERSCVEGRAEEVLKDENIRTAGIFMLIGLLCLLISYSIYLFTSDEHTVFEITCWNNETIVDRVCLMTNRTVTADNITIFEKCGGDYNTPCSSFPTLDVSDGTRCCSRPPSVYEVVEGDCCVIHYNITTKDGIIGHGSSLDINCDGNPMDSYTCYIDGDGKMIDISSYLTRSTDSDSHNSTRRYLIVAPGIIYIAMVFCCMTFLYRAKYTACV